MSAPSKQEIRKVVLASLLGATIEWYDFFLYGVVAGIVFNKLFFPTTDPFIGTILAYSTFAIGYLARPLGGFVFGHCRADHPPDPAPLPGPRARRRMGRRGAHDL